MSREQELEAARNELVRTLWYVAMCSKGLENRVRHLAPPSTLRLSSSVHKRQSIGAHDVPELIEVAVGHRQRLVW